MIVATTQQSDRLDNSNRKRLSPFAWRPARRRASWVEVTRGRYLKPRSLVLEMKTPKPRGAQLSRIKRGYRVACPVPSYTYFASSPVGRLEVAICQNGLHSINITESSQIAATLPAKREACSCQLAFTEDRKVVAPAIVEHHASCLSSWLSAYFFMPSTLKDVIVPTMCESYASVGGAFARLVRKTLATDVPFGSRLSYSGLAARCGSERASRAVGQAMRTNPLPILVPCHRVVLASGMLGNYAGGTKNAVKKWLLDHEAEHARIN